MRIHVVNPNSTMRMTDGIAQAAEKTADERFEVVVTSDPSAPAAIETAADALLAAPLVVAQVAAHADCDGHVIACFDDPAIDACREVADGPVLGIAQGAMIAAAQLGARFGVITTAEAGIPIIEDMARAYGQRDRLSSVRSCDRTVLELDGSDETLAVVERTARELLADGAESLVLGCAGLSGLAERLQTRVSVPVVDGVRATVGIVAGLAAAGLRTSRRGVYASSEVTR